MKQIAKFAVSMSIVGAVLAPSLAFALTQPSVPVSGQGLTFTKIITVINTVVQQLMTVSVVLGVGAFVYGAIQYFALNKEKEGKALMFRAVIGVGLILAIGLILNTIAGVIKNQSLG